MVRYLSVLPLFLALSAANAQQGTPTNAAVLRPDETLLQVVAHGSIKAVPDTATLTTSVLGDGVSADAARSKTAATTQRLIDAVRATGVSNDAMRTEALRVVPRFKPRKDGDDTDVIIGYRAETKLRIRLRDVALVSRIFDALSAAGADRIEGPEFAFSDDVPLKARARAAAVASAPSQALDYARPFGLHVARILRISERRSDAESGQDIIVTGTRRGTVTPPLLPGDQEVTADVWIDYALVR